MTDFLRLASGLAAYNSGQYDGYVIGRAKWQLSGEVYTVESRIKEERNNYLEIEVTGYDKERGRTGRLLVTMLKEGRGFTAEKKKIGQECGGGGFFFRKQQIDCYLKTVQDTNSIHHGDHAVVPGLMLVDFMLELGVIPKIGDAHVIRFKAPLFLGIPFVTVTQKKRLCITSPDGDICYARLD